MKNKLIGIALAVTLLVTGAVVGAVIDRTWIRDRSTATNVDRPRGRRNRHKRLLKIFRKRLDLTDAQAAAVEKILSESRSNGRKQRIKARENIKKVLNPEQVKKYEEMIERRRKRRKRHRRRGHRGRRAR